MDRYTATCFQNCLLNFQPYKTQKSTKSTGRKLGTEWLVTREYLWWDIEAEQVLRLQRLTPGVNSQKKTTHFLIKSEDSIQYQPEYLVLNIENSEQQK